jgi:putative endonuclease
LKTYSNTPKSLLNCVTSILNKFSSSTPIVIGAEGGAKKPSEMMAFFYFRMTYFVYIIYSVSIDRYYVGYSANPWNRLNQHNSNTKDKYTGRATDWILKSTFEVENEAVAIHLERFIKKQKSRNLIIRMCNPEFIGTNELAQLVRVPHVRD